MFEIIGSSPQALAKVDPALICDGVRDTPNVHQRAIYPFERLLIRESFTLDMSKESSIRNQASRAMKLLDRNRKFTVIVHRDRNLVEVARIA